MYPSEPSSATSTRSKANRGKTNFDGRKRFSGVSPVRCALWHSKAVTRPLVVCCLETETTYSPSHAPFGCVQVKCFTVPCARKAKRQLGEPYIQRVLPQWRIIDGLIGDCGMEFVMPDFVKWQSGGFWCFNGVVDGFCDYSSDCIFSKALAIRSKSSILGSFLSCCGGCFM